MIVDKLLFGILFCHKQKNTRLLYNYLHIKLYTSILQRIMIIF